MVNKASKATAVAVERAETSPGDQTLVQLAEDAAAMNGELCASRCVSRSVATQYLSQLS